MNRRDFGLVTMGGVAVAALGTEGCTAGGILSELQAWVPLGIAAFDGIAVIVDSVFTTVATTVDALWAAVNNAISLYNHTADPTVTTLDKVIATLDALAGGLTQAVAALPISIPAAALNAAKLGLALLIGTLKSIQAKLEPTPAPIPAAMKAVIGTTVPATSQKDFIAKFNAIMAANGQALRVK
jgi:hypothetical protein